MIKIRFRKFTLLKFLFVTSTIIACGSDDNNGQPQLDIDKFKSQITAIDDVSNNENASDIRVSFDGASANSMIQEYRIILARNTSIANVNIEAVIGLPADRYTSIANNQSNFQENLMATQQDYEGGEIIVGPDYNAFVLTIGTFNNEQVYVLSDASAAFKLTNMPVTRTLVSNLQANDALSIDADGNIYVSNYGAYDNSIGMGNGQTALKITPAGEVSNFVSGLSSPVGNAIDAEGNFYVNNDNDFTSGDLLKIGPDGNRTTITTIQGYPSGLLLGANGNFFVSNYIKPVVSEVTPSGVITEFAVDQRLAGGVGIAYDDDGNILVGNLITGDILSIDGEGNVSLIATIPTVIEQSVIGYITYFEDHVYATGGGAKKIYKVSLSGTITEFAGNGTSISKDGEFSEASFAGPNGIAIDKNSRLLYVSDAAPGGGAELRVIPLD